MNLYFLFLVFLCGGGCYARVVPLNFKQDESNQMDPSIFENELIDDSPTDEVEILGHSVPDIKQGNGFELLNSEDKNTSFLDSSNRNTSNLPVELTSNGKDAVEDSNLESAESMGISDLSEKELNSTSESISQTNSGSFGTWIEGQNDKTENLTLKNETSVTDHSSTLDLEQENNMEIVETEKKILNGTLDQNETFASFENIKVTNSTDNNTQRQTLSNDTEVETFASDAENIMENLESNDIASDISNDSEKTAGGILSGFEFLINSEVARNAAKAIEVFNFSDPLTDHIMEENEFHSFLPAFNAELDLHSSPKMDVETVILFANTSGDSNEILTDFNKSLVLGEENSVVFNQDDPEETSIALNQTESLKIKKGPSTSLNQNEALDGRNETEFFNLVDKSDRNVTDVLSPLENSKEKIQLVSEDTILKENINGSITNSSAVVPECPPPGWCIFWFLSQDTCAVNAHCHGSRICCRIGCAKTCIELESS